MIEKKERLPKVTIFSLLVLIIVHSFLHIFIFNSGDFSFYQYEITQLSDLKDIYTNFEYYSLAVLTLELLILTLVLIRKDKVTKPTKIRDLEHSSSSSKTKTDIDTLYDKLKEKKKLKIADIANSFNVSEEVVFDWGKILESADLASINYPKIGKPELILSKGYKEGVKNEKQE